MTRRHPGLDRLRAFAAGAPTATRERVSSHLQECPSCRNTITAMREVVTAAREDFAPAAPAGAFERVVQRRAAGERVILPVANPPAPRSSPLRRAMPWAVGLLVAMAGAAAAVPGSPLRTWIEAQFRSETPIQTDVPMPVVAPQPAPVAADTAVSGISVPVSDRELWVTVQPDAQPLRIRLAVTDAQDLEVRALGGAAGATFRPRADGVSVANANGGEVEIDVPRRVRRFVLRVGDVRYALKDGDRLRVLAATADTVAGVIVFQVRP